jgi:hypothetical protein
VLRDVILSVGAWGSDGVDVLDVLILAVCSVGGESSCGIHCDGNNSIGSSICE